MSNQNKREGTIIKIMSDFYYIESDNVTYTCKARGKFRKNDLIPVVGDNVEITITNDQSYSSIERILKRNNHLVRPPLANLDLLFIVVSTAEPKPNLFNIDQILTICEYKDIETAIILNKCDLASPDELIEIYKAANVKIFTTVATDDLDTTELINYIGKRRCAFIGNTGVGKSSVLNTLIENGNITTAHISKKLGRGRHTTRHVEFYPLFTGGFVADTPGFSTMDFTKYNIIEPSQLQYCIPEFAPFLNMCKYATCTHTTEKGCAVLDAVNSGDISKSRHASFTAMLQTTKQYKPWEHKNND